MATKKPPYSAKAKVWLPTYTMELDGSARGIIHSTFRSLPAEMREKVLDDLNKSHAAICEKEAEQAESK